MKPSDLPPRIEAQIKIDPDSGCWLWAGNKMKNGYGRYGKPRRLIHRVVYELLVGPIPAGLTLDHVRDRGCVHKNCCWPVHLESVTLAENLRRRGLTGMGALYAARTHCDRGHEFTLENTVPNYAGGRACLTCRRDSRREACRIKRGYYERERRSEKVAPRREAVAQKWAQGKDRRTIADELGLSLHLVANDLQHLKRHSQLDNPTTRQNKRMK